MSFELGGRYPRAVLIFIICVVAGILAIGANGFVAFEGIWAGAQAGGSRVGERILGRVRDGALWAVYAEAAPAYQTQSDREETVNLLRSVEARVGRPLSWTVDFMEKKTIYVGTDGVFNGAIYMYEVTHEHGKTHTELIVDEQDRLLGFDFQVVR